ncbi:GAP family protein [Leucobacter allii]|uniref:GAP family protein n=1 Tax=Leucobacter allii TaxID=2932247 RepID=UPI001FD1D89E|nr:GAP family protein [Leucobacter allii]UOR02645.1 GAP family protein [Leucobacter allii]
MDFLDTVPLPAALALLALLDGLSVGTLLIPLFFLIAPGRVRAGRILLYLATITGFYLVIGVLFLLGLGSIIELAADALASDAGAWLLLVVGVALFASGLLVWAADARRRRLVAAGRAAPEAGRIVRWRERVLDERANGGAVMGVAIAAGLVEIAGMLPYLLGMTMLAGSPLGAPARVAYLAGYCAVMVLPALVLLAARIVAAPVVAGPLERLAAWFQRTGAENTSWILCIVGFLVVRSAAQRLEIALPIIG